MAMTRVYAIGDVHGDFKPIRAFYQNVREKLPSTDKVVLICLGDFGANYFFNYRDEEFKKKLGTYNIEYFVIRGNHEERPENCAANSPAAWKQEIYFGNLVWVEKEYPYIKIRVNTNGHANAVYKTNVTEEFKGLIDSVSISLNASNKEEYNDICKPKIENAYGAMLDFTSSFLPSISLIPDIPV
jgi:hypothetical protein